MIKNRFYSSLKKKYYNNCSINNICFNNKDSLNKNYPLNSTEGSSLSYNNNKDFVLNSILGSLFNIKIYDNKKKLKNKKEKVAMFIMDLYQAIMTLQRIKTIFLKQEI